jgi:hypothetical protein
MAITTKGTIIWDLMLCKLTDVFRRFGGTYCLHLHARKNKPSKEAALRLSHTSQGGDGSVRSNSWMMISRGNLKELEGETSSSAISSMRNFIWNHKELPPRLLGEKPKHTHLSHGTNCNCHAGCKCRTDFNAMCLSGDKQSVYTNHSTNQFAFTLGGGG